MTGGRFLSAIVTLTLLGTALTLLLVWPTGPVEHRRIDVHTHLYPDLVEPAARLVAAHGIHAMVNLSGGVPGYGLEQQLAAAARAPVPVVVFTNIDWDQFGRTGWTEERVEALERSRALGARGLKISKALGLGVRDIEGSLVAVDDPRLDPLFAAAGRLGLPVSIHTGDPVAFFEPPDENNERWDELSLNPQWSFHNPRFPSWEEVFAQFVARVTRSPETTFIGVHFGNAPEDPARVSELLDRLPNLYIDTAARVGEIGRDDRPGRRDLLRSLFRRHRKRILFGTDLQVMPGSLVFGAPELPAHTAADAGRFFGAHWAFFETNELGLAHPTPIQGRWTVSGLGLSDAILADVYRKNAQRVIGGLDVE